MTSPLLNAVTYIVTAVALALGVPWLIVRHVLSTGNLVAAVIIAPAIVVLLMAISVALVSVMAAGEREDQSMPLGPSLLAGFGLLTVYMVVMPVLAGPGIVWLYVLPFDIHGFFDWDNWVGLDFEAAQPPHHPSGEGAE